MRKVVSVHLANELFQIEEEGYNAIQQVLKKIEVSSQGKPEVTKDIEQRIAMQLREKALPLNGLVTYEIVIEVVTDMGFGGYVNSTNNKNSTFNNAPRSGYRRLYRNPNEKILGGVCSGLAGYLNTDPVLIRILFLFLFFPGLIGYIIMWIVIPEARTPEQFREFEHQ